MDFSSAFASYGEVTDTNLSPTNEFFTYPVAVDESDFTMSPSASAPGFFDCDPSFTPSFAPTESDAVSQPISSKGGPAPSPTFQDTTPFGQLEPPSMTGFSFGDSIDFHQQQDLPNLPEEQSHRPFLKREPTSESASNAQTTPRPRKHHRRPRPPQDTLSASTTSTDTSSTTRTTRRLPHNQVERKYRENLNAELERLRRAIPQNTVAADDETATNQAKPSKAMVLAGAIEYIEQLERERDEYRAECDRLRNLMR